MAPRGHYGCVYDGRMSSNHDTPAVLAEDCQQLAAALDASGARRVECAMADFSAIARGKLALRADALAGCKLPSVLLGMTLTGGAPTEMFGSVLPSAYTDLALIADASTLAPRPGRAAEASVICEPSASWHAPRYGRELGAHELSPRAALRRVLAAWADAGLRATVAPELELFLLQRRIDDSGVRLEAASAAGASGAREAACEQYSLERATQFEAYFDDLYAGAEALRIPLSGHLHEAALSQYEVNFAPGEPLAQADAVWRFKRLARELAVRHGFLATFAAKPFLDQPGTGMHWHFSVQRDAAAWPHLFATPDGASTAALGHFVAGVQRGAPAAMALFAPYDMSFERIALSDASPTHADWGEDDRHAALRIPASGAVARRVENRLPGGDANPYLVVAATLALGLEGLCAAQAPLAGRDDALKLPRTLPEALAALQHSAVLRQWLGAPLVDLYVALKSHEHGERNASADARQWDLRHLIELA